MALTVVTGAAGHLGNTIVRELCVRGERVRACIRSGGEERFAGLDCEVVRADLRDEYQARAAMDGADVCIQAAAVYRHWMPDPEKDIVQANMDITRNVLHAAAAHRLKRVVYVSSIAALDQRGEVLTPDSWNAELDDHYYRSKTLSERLAWELAEELDMDMVAVLPAGMLGPNQFDTLTDTMHILEQILANAFPVEPGFGLHLVDVRDVARATVEAALRGRRGERYILGCEEAVPSENLFDVARTVSPTVKKPRKISKCTLKIMVGLMEGVSRVLHTKPKLLRSQVDIYHGVVSRLDISKSQADLDFAPRPARVALAEAFAFMLERQTRRAA